MLRGRGVPFGKLKRRKMVSIFEYSSAVRGYHYYKRYWTPVESQTLDCQHEIDNPYDFFAIKITDRQSGAIVGHLPMENSRATKYLLDRGARVVATLTSTNYCVSPLVQGGLEIPCLVNIFMPLTLKNKQLIDIYRNYIDVLYYEREESNIVGSFIAEQENESADLPNVTEERVERKKSLKVTHHKDIRSFFKRGSSSSNGKKSASKRKNQASKRNSPSPKRKEKSQKTDNVITLSSETESE